MTTPRYGEFEDHYQRIAAALDGTPGGSSDAALAHTVGELQHLAHAAPIDWAADPCTAMIYTVLTGLHNPDGYPRPGLLLQLALRHGWDAATIDRLAAAAGLVHRFIGSFTLDEVDDHDDGTDEDDDDHITPAAAREWTRQFILAHGPAAVSVKSIADAALESGIVTRRGTVSEYLASLVAARQVFPFRKSNGDPIYGYYVAIDPSSVSTERDLAAGLDWARRFVLQAGQPVDMETIIEAAAADGIDVRRDAVQGWMDQMAAERRLAFSPRDGWYQTNPTWPAGPALYDPLRTGPDGHPRTATIRDGQLRFGGGAGWEDVDLPVTSVLIVAARGGGKTNLIQQLIAEAALSDRNVIWTVTTNSVSSPAVDDLIWRDGDQRPIAVDRTAAGPADVRNMFAGIRDVINSRAATRMQEKIDSDGGARVATDDHPNLIVFVDDLDDLAGRQPSLVGELTDLMRRGRTWGVHFVVASQGAAADVVTNQLLKSFDVRICGMVNDAAEAERVFQLPIHRLPGDLPEKPGEFLARHNGTLRAFTAYLFSIRASVLALAEAVQSRTPIWLPGPDTPAFPRRTETPPTSG